MSIISDIGSWKVKMILAKLTHNMNVLFVCREQTTKPVKEIRKEMQNVIKQIVSSVTFLPYIDERCKLFYFYFNTCFVLLLKDAYVDMSHMHMRVNLFKTDSLFEPK